MNIVQNKSEVNNPAVRPVSVRQGVHARLFALALRHGMNGYERMVRTRKHRLLGGLSGRILEIGPGAGVNLPFYPASAEWLGVEPNRFLHEHIQSEARRLNRSVRLTAGVAERLPVADETVDAVVSTLVLCSVTDVRRALDEVKRVLRPGGRFVFLEHVAADRGARTRTIQKLVRPLWTWAGDGCRPDRELWIDLERAGFSTLHLEHFRLNLPVVGPHIMGYGVK